MSTKHEPWDDPRITAYVMQELSPTESAEFEAEMRDQPELAKAAEEARRVTEQLADFYASMPTSTLDADRRAQITGAAVNHPVESGAGPRYSGWRIVTWAIAASILFIAVALPLWQMPKIRTASHSISERTSPEPTTSAKPQSDVITASAVEPPPELESGPQPNSTFDAVADRDTGDTTESSFADVAASEPTAPVVELKAARGRPMSLASPAAPARSVADADAKKNVEMAGTELNLNETLSIGDMSSGMAIDEEMEMMGDMGGGIGGMGTRGMMGGKRMPSAVTRRQASPGRDEFMRFGMPETDQGTGPGSPGDKFSPLGENEFRRVSEHPLSTFSIDVDTASYAKVRSYLESHRLPRLDSVRIEEMVNYFDYDYAGPTASDAHRSDPLAAAMAATICPWNPEHRLVRIGLQATRLTDEERPRCNLVFLIDTSGSMSQPNKLPLVIEGLKVLLDELRDDDRIAIVAYAGSAGLVLDSTPVKERPRIARALTQLRSGGSTNGGAGLQLAYDTAREHLFQDGVNRVILCSDGDFNVGMTGTDALVREARTQAKSGVDLTVLGFGMGNHNDAMMEKISNDAEGNYAFVDSIAEARKVLANQLTGTLVTVAKDVKIQVEFNPAVVSAYRLIGYENRLLAKEDFNDDTKDAGEIGAGHQVTALYEIVPVGVEAAAIAPPVDELKYQPLLESQAEPENEPIATGDIEPGKPTTAEMLTLKLRYKQPQGTESQRMTQVLEESRRPFDQADRDFRFAASVAAFGMLLRESSFAGTWTYDDVRRQAEQSIGSDPHGLRAEFVGLVKAAEALTVRE